MTAHPPRTRWHVETYDAGEWSSGLPLHSRRAAVDKLNRLTNSHPQWADGTACKRRIVLETTTYEDYLADPADKLARFPKAGFLLPCIGGQDLAAIPGTTPDGRPAIRFSVGSSDTGHAEAVVSLEMLEEVIAGLRDMARQAGHTPEPVTAHLSLGAAAEATVRGLIGRTVRRGPEEAGA